MSDVTYLSGAETAKCIRRALGATFPGVKFGVRCSRGSAINVTWTDGPVHAVVEAVAGPFQGKRFDGSIDMESSVRLWLLPDGSVTVASDPGTTGSGGARERQEIAKPHPDAKLISTGVYVFCTRATSPDLQARVAAFIARRGGWHSVWRAQDEDHAVHMLARRSMLRDGALFVVKDAHA